MRFYQLPLNFGSPRSYSGGVVVPQVQDNKLSTTWAGRTIRLFIDTDGDGTGTAREFDAVYVRCKGATRIHIDSLGENVDITDTISDGNGNDISIIDADGYHSFLYQHDSKGSDTDVNITFNADTEVAQLWILNEDKSIQISNDSRFTQLDFDEIDRGATVRPSATNVMHYIPPIGGNDLKIDITATCRFRPQHATYQNLRKFFRDNRQGFVAAIDYPAEPELVKQYITDPQSRLRYITQYKYAGKNYTFSLIER